MTKIKLSLAPVNGGAFNCPPAREVELEPSRILCNDVILPWETFNPHSVRLWVIGNEFGALGAVWASDQQEAFDILVDAGLGDGLLIEEADADEDSARLGNASEPANLDHAWIQLVDLKSEGQTKLLCQFAEARGSQATTLDTTGR